MPSGPASAQPEVTDVLSVGVRAYGWPEGKSTDVWEFSSRGPSAWQLVFDTETTTDQAQRLRLGAYQLREGYRLRETGLFFNAKTLRSGEKEILHQYAKARRLKLISVAEFVDEILIGIAYRWQATIIGFNLPFDLSRLAERHGSARGKMRPGFSFEATPQGRASPHIRIKHLSRRASLIEFSGSGQRLPRSQRKRKIRAPSRRSAFVDVSCLASALLSHSYSLGALAAHLNTAHQKLGTDEHGKKLTPQYLDYAVRDVQVTWECFVELRHRYAEHGLTRTPIHRILSEASIGKGYLREMCIRPWREMQPEFPRALIGKIMGTYFGGRTEVHQRRVIAEVLYCDFTSMYPTVSTLMGLWRFVVAKGVKWRDATAETREFLRSVTVAELQHKRIWRGLHVIVEVAPDADILPLRTKYGYESLSAAKSRAAHYTIGLNYVTSAQPLWYTLADCIASKLLTGRSPKILQAITFEAHGVQEDLQPVAIGGKPEFRVDPLRDDLFKRLIELRMETRGSERNALKLVANATGYGIFVQLDVNEQAEKVAVHCYPATGPEFIRDMDQVERPGEFFHPLLGTLITGAARLMLAIAEKLVADAGLTWAFCDTDSMAIAKPDGVRRGQFIQQAEAVRNWFGPLNPYSVKVDLFKLEAANFRVVESTVTKEFEPLYCFAISSKRYALFNIDAAGRPVIRKASAHGLGHLLPPYRDPEAPSDLPAPQVDLNEVGVNRWQHDFWYCILSAALAGNPDQPDFSRLPNFGRPAVSQYAVTTAHLSPWFAKYNEGKPYTDQVRPFNFMLIYQPDLFADWDSWRESHGVSTDDPNATTPSVISPYDSDLRKAEARCFDRDTGTPVPTSMLKSYRDTLAQYHLRPEPKFVNADHLDRGETCRRHIKAAGISYIGKEANRWEEQSYLGIDPGAEVAYGSAPQNLDDLLAPIRDATKEFGPSALATSAGLSRQHLHMILAGAAKPKETILQRLNQSAAKLRLNQEHSFHETQIVSSWIRTLGIRRSAELSGISAGHLARILSGKRTMTISMLQRFAQAATINTQLCQPAPNRRSELKSFR